jgi:hypothetical protein
VAKVRRQKFLSMDSPEATTSRLNEFANDVVNCLTHGVSLTDNLYGDVKDIDYVSTALPVIVSTTFPRPPIAVLALGASTQGGNGEVQSGGIVTWRHEGGRVVISSISGLTAGVLYKVKIAMVAG